MDEKTLFSASPKNPNQPLENAPPVKDVSNIHELSSFEDQAHSTGLHGDEGISSSVQPPQSASNVFQAEPGPASMPPPLPPSPPIEEESGFNFGRVTKIGIGALVVFILIFLAVFFIPKIFNRGEEDITLTYWGLWEDSATMQGMLSDFQRQHPNITIKYERQDIKQYREKLSTRFANDTGPDVFRFHSSWLPVLANYLTPLPNNVISKDELSNNYYPMVKNDVVKDGAIYGVPLGVDTLQMYINTDLFDAAGASPPTNWEDFIRLSRQLTVKDENGNIKTAGAALGTFDNVTHAPDIISMLFFQNGADIYNLSGTQQQASDALSFYTSFATGDSNVWDSTLDSSLNAFAKGELAIYFGYSWDFFTIKAMNPQLNFLVASVPALPGQNITNSSYWVEGISTKTKNKEAAFLFLKYLSQKEAQTRLFADASKTRLFGEPYSRKDLASLLSDNRYVKPFVEGANNAVSSFFVDSTYDNAINTQMNTYLGNAVNEILNGSSADSAVETLSKGVAQVLAQYATER